MKYFTELCRLLFTRCVFFRGLFLLISLLVVMLCIRSYIRLRREAVEYRQQYEDMVCLTVLEATKNGKAIREGHSQVVLERYDRWLGREALLMNQELRYHPGLKYWLWSIKSYYRKYNLVTSQELEQMFQGIPNEKPHCHSIFYDVFMMVSDKDEDEWSLP